MTEAVYTYWPKPRQIGELMAEGKPRRAPWDGESFDLSWSALDAWAVHLATGKPCEVVVTGYGKRVDGVYWYVEALNPVYLRDVLGWRDWHGRLAPVCAECDRFPTHARGCPMRE